MPPTAPPVDAARTDFAVSIYEEHLEEVAFLYEQRQALFDDPEVSWQDLGDFEDRLGAHLDGLVIGGEAALECCRERAIDGETGETYAAVWVCCARNRQDLVVDVMKAFDAGDAARVRAFGDALVEAAPAGWLDSLIPILAGEPSLLPAAALLAGTHRLPIAGTLLQALPQADPETARTLIWALGRLRASDARAPLYRTYLNHTDDAIRAEAARALLRIGEPQTLPYLAYLKYPAWSLISAGLGGRPEDVDPLLRRAGSDQATPEGLLALGLLGHAPAVPTLLPHLNNPDHAEAAAVALHLITGAALEEEVFLPDEIDEDDLFDDELERFRNDEPVYPPGEEPGVYITRLSQQPDAWRAWLAQSDRLQPNIRYRLGQPYGPGALLTLLADDRSTAAMRRWAGDELAVRYQAPVPFEADWPVARQQQALEALTAWTAETAGRFTPGAWYFAGQQIR